MLSIEQIRERMSDRNVSEVARRIGVTRVWLMMILKEGSTATPSYKLLCKLNDYLDGDYKYGEEGDNGMD